MRNSAKQGETALNLDHIVNNYEEKRTKFYKPMLSTLIFLIFWVPHKVVSTLKSSAWKGAVKRWKAVTAGASAPENFNEIKKPTTACGSPSSTAVHISKYLELLNTSQNLENPQPGRPLIIFYSWLMAKKHHVQKYLDLFSKLQLDVLKVCISPVDVLQPTTRSQVAAREVLEFLKSHPQYDRLVVYGCSVGAYAFGEVCVLMQEHPAKFSSISERFVGQVFDSPVDILHMPHGVAASLATSPKKQALIVSYVEWFLTIRYKEATRHYIKSATLVRAGAVQCPALCLYSKEDDLSPDHVNESIFEGWRQAGLQVNSVVFENSPHCAMLGYHPQKYEEAVTKFFNGIEILNLNSPTGKQIDG